MMKMNTEVYLLDRWTGDIFLIDGFRRMKVVRYEEELPVPVVTDGN